MGPGFGEQVRIITGTDLGRRIRDRSALITAFAAPLALAVVFGSLFSSAGGGGFVIGVGAGDDPIARDIAAALVTADDTADDEVVRFVDVASERAAAAVEGDDLDSAVVVGAGIAEGTASLRVVGDAERPISADIARSVAARTAAVIDRTALGAAVAASLGTAPPTGAVTAEPYVLAPSDLGGRSLDAMAFFGASMAMVLLFFTVGFAAHSILVDKRTSVLDRLLAGPTSPSAILTGKTLSVSITALSGFVVVWSVTQVVFGAEWGDPLTVAVLILATVAALSGVATFVASFATTERQAETLTSVVTFGLAILGGNFTGPQNVPPLLDSIAQVIPNGVALRAFTEVSADAANVADIGGALLRLVAFAAVFGGVGLWRIGRSIAA